MRLTFRGKLLVFFIAGVVAWWAGLMWASALSSHHYVNIKVRARCLQAEDTAAHLKLIEYDPDHHVFVYSCYEGGY